MKKVKEYAIYRGDVFIGIGTRKELAQQLNVKEKTIHFYSTLSYKKRIVNGRKRLVAEVLD